MKAKNFSRNKTRKLSRKVVIEDPSNGDQSLPDASIQTSDDGIEQITSEINLTSINIPDNPCAN